MTAKTLKHDATLYDWGGVQQAVNYGSAVRGDKGRCSRA